MCALGGGNGENVCLGEVLSQVGGGRELELCVCGGGLELYRVSLALHHFLLSCPTRPAGRDYRNQPVSQLVCSCSGRQLWGDTLAGHTMQMAGSLKFSAVSTSCGDLQVGWGGGGPSSSQLSPPAVGTCRWGGDRKSVV